MCGSSKILVHSLYCWCHYDAAHCAVHATVEVRSYEHHNTEVEWAWIPRQAYTFNLFWSEIEPWLYNIRCISFLWMWFWSVPSETSPEPELSLPIPLQCSPECAGVSAADGAKGSPRSSSPSERPEALGSAAAEALEGIQMLAKLN